MFGIELAQVIGGIRYAMPILLIDLHSQVLDQTMPLLLIAHEMLPSAWSASMGVLTKGAPVVSLKFC